MKTYVQRGKFDRYEKSVIEIESLNELIEINLALKLQKRQLEGWAEVYKESIDRIRNGDPLFSDDTLEKTTERYNETVEEMQTVQTIIDSLATKNEIVVQELSMNYVRKE